jgi:hypothetical protein
MMKQVNFSVRLFLAAVPVGEVWKGHEGVCAMEVEKNHVRVSRNSSGRKRSTERANYGWWRGAARWGHRALPLRESQR